jgi:hypothetical protein
MDTNYLDIWSLNSTWNLLSCINFGDKLSIHGNQIEIQKNHMFLGLKRMYYGDSRKDIHKLIEDLINMSEYHLKEGTNDIEKVKNFRLNILKGLRGLINLKKTYNNDILFLSLFNSSLEQIKKIEQYYNEEELNEKYLELENLIFMKKF